MCRFLLFKSSTVQNLRTLIQDFAEMSERSRAPDGDWQGDGWGMAWLNSEKKWETHKSLKPIWQDFDSFEKLPPTSHLALHARSASFPGHKGIIAYNQPFSNKDYVFVFNGIIKGVKFNRPIPGKIGAQKIWTLLQEKLDKSNDLQNILKDLSQDISKHSQEVDALNVGLLSGTEAVAVCNFKPNNIIPDYHKLFSFRDENSSIICSEPLSGYKFEAFKSGEVRDCS